MIRPEETSTEFVEKVVERVGRTPDMVIPLLHEIQDKYRYLPPDALRHLCEVTDITPAAVEGVSTFYDCFRHRPAGENSIRVCHGTACHVKGSVLVEDAIRRELNIPKGDDTDADRKFTVERVACVGCCSLAPVVQIEEETYGYVTSQSTPKVINGFKAAQTLGDSNQGTGVDRLWKPQNKAVIGEVTVSMDSCCMVSRPDKVLDSLRETADQLGLPVRVKQVGCKGLCSHGPAVSIHPADGVEVSYAGVQADQAGELLTGYFKPPRLIDRLGQGAARMLDRFIDGADENPSDKRRIDVIDPELPEVEARQVRVASEHFGKLDPLDLEEFEAHDGFVAWKKCLEEGDPSGVTDTVKASGLRGRGGGGFPTGLKWTFVSGQEEKQRYVICNGDEGDPGAFMDRMLMESFPYRVIEGLAIAAFAVGAQEGFFYIRHEYPLAVKRIQKALDRCEEAGLLGDNILGSGYSLKLSIREGAGAFVCGEETALISSIEGGRGMPTPRPPYPAQSGLWGKPTLVNNVETLASLSWILRNGPEAYSKYGTETSKGTKVFALAGRVKRSGLIEVPMGTTIREIVFDIGGGIVDGKAFKAVQIGGPSGGCIPASMADTPVDYEALTAAGAIMGSGGMVVLDETDCMVDLARYFLEFTQDQSCGKCTFCRVGTMRMRDILERLCEGKGKKADLDSFEMLAVQVQAASICGLGQTAPNPVLSTLRYFRDEYEAHLDGYCPSGKCTKLIHYQVNDKCVGCTLCAQACPVDAIATWPYRRHLISDETCIRCDACLQVCPHDAIEVN